MPLASLPWYDNASTAESLDFVYHHFRQQLLQMGVAQVLLSDQLDRHTALHRQWSDESLILSQCCGPDLLAPHGQALRAFARPIFAALDCQAGYYFSYIVARSQAINQHQTIAINNLSSFSGCTALLQWLSETDQPYNNFYVTGSHLRSADLVRDGIADVAAIDAYAWRFVRRDGLQIVDRSRVAPAPPFVCHLSAKIDHGALTQALQQAFRVHGESLAIGELMPGDNRFYQDYFTSVASLRPADCKSLRLEVGGSPVSHADF